MKKATFTEVSSSMAWTMIFTILLLHRVLGTASKILTEEETGKAWPPTHNVTPCMTVSETRAVAGGVAKLPCDMTPPMAGDRVHLVIWYKEGAPSPIYSFDSRGKTPDQAKHWSDEHTLGGRAFFRFSEEPAKLAVESVKDEDGGAYKCRVDFKKSPTRNTKVNLTVILPPEKLTILDEKSAGVTDHTIGPYNEGATVDITCIATGGRPTPRVSWWQENALLDDSFETLGDRRVKNVLRLERLERRHLHNVYTCQASNNNLVAPISSAVTLDLNLRPLSVRLTGENRPLSADNTYELACQAVGSRPAAVITWWKGSVPLRNTRETMSTDGNITTSVLTFVPSLEDGGKFLSCRGSNPLIPDSALEDGWKLNIHHVPIVTLELGSNLNASTIREGVDVYFECNIKSNPWVYRVTWRHNGKMLSNNASAGTIVSNQSLVLQSVTRARAGLYTCVGSNQEGDGESNPVYLDVKYAPVCKPGQQNLFGVARQEAARIPCQLDANPTDVHFIWKFNNTSETIDIPQAHMNIDRARSVATYSPMTELDYGTLLCWGRNELGMQQQPCVFHIIPAGKPDALYNCSIVNQTAESLHVECTEGFDGGLPQGFTMEVYDGQSLALVSNVSSKTPSFTVSGLEPGLSFTIELSASNTKGRSAKSILHAYTLKAAEKRTECSTGAGCVAAATSPAALLQMTPILGVLIGVVSALFLVAVIIVVVMRLRGHDDEDEVEKELEERIGGSGGRQGPATMSRGVGGPVPCGGDKTVKDTDIDSVDEKNPDIIPQSNDSEYMDADEKAFEKLNNLPPRLYDTGHHMTVGRNNRMEPASSYETVTMNNTINNTPGMPGEEITYAELALPKHPLYQSHTLGRPSRSTLQHPAQHEATVYAQIMDVKMGHAPLLAQHHAATLQRPRAMHVQVPAAPTLLRMRPGPEQGDAQNTPLIGHRESTEGVAGPSEQQRPGPQQAPRVVSATRF